MSRPLRIEYPGAWYHVMNRGRRSEAIFSDNQDYLMFIDLMVEISEMWHVYVAAYCLMTNHFHLKPSFQQYVNIITCLLVTYWYQDAGNLMSH